MIRIGKYNLKINYSNLNTFLFLLLFIFLEFEYYDFVNLPVFQRIMGFKFEFDLIKFIIAHFFAIFLIDLNNRHTEINYFINSFFLMFLSFPAIILFEFMPNTPPIIVLFIIFFHLLSYVSFVYKPRVRLIKNRINQQQIIWFIAGLAFIMLIPFFLAYGLKVNFRVFLFKDIYEVRAIAAQKATFITSYFLSWLMKIVIPIGLVLGLKNKKWLLFSFFTLAQIYLFTLAGHRSAFISFFVVFILFIDSHRKQISVLLLTIILLIIASKLVTITTGNLIAESTIVRRAFFLPAIIMNDYFDFFKGNHTYLSYSILHNYIEYPFDLQPPQLIGKYYFNHETANVNSGFISDGFMNFGNIGVIINIFIVVAITRVFQFVKVPSIYSGIILIILYTLISSFLFTSLLTHGILLFMLLILFL